MGLTNAPEEGSGHVEERWCLGVGDSRGERGLEMDPGHICQPAIRQAQMDSGGGWPNGRHQG